MNFNSFNTSENKWCSCLFRCAQMIECTTYRVVSDYFRLEFNHLMRIDAYEWRSFYPLNITHQLKTKNLEQVHCKFCLKLKWNFNVKFQLQSMYWNVVNTSLYANTGAEHFNLFIGWITKKGGHLTCHAY